MPLFCALFLNLCEVLCEQGLIMVEEGFTELDQDGLCFQDICVEFTFYLSKN